MMDSAAELLAPLRADQQTLVEVAFHALTKHDVWPSVRYLERQLATPTLAALMASFPTLGSVHYSAVWATSVGGMHQAESAVGLTVAGLAHVDDGDRSIDPYLTMLRAVSRRLNDLL